MFGNTTMYRLLPLLHLAYSLRCFHNCSRTFTMNHKFVAPTNCTYVSRDQCSAELVFWYDRNSYMVSFPGQMSFNSSMVDNGHLLMIEMEPKRSFSYHVKHACKSGRNCALRFAKNTVKHMARRTYNTSDIYIGLEYVFKHGWPNYGWLYGVSTNYATQPPVPTGKIGTCTAVYDILRRKSHPVLCSRRTRPNNSVEIFTSDDVSMVVVKCDRMYCNRHTDTSKFTPILYRHKVLHEFYGLTAASSRLSSMGILLLSMLFFSVSST